MAFHLLVTPNDPFIKALVRAFVVFMGVGYLAVTPVPGDQVMIDHEVFIRAVESMRQGEGYYEAMDASLQRVYGPSESIRAFREPALFWLFSALPSNWSIWALLVALVVATGWLMVDLTDTPISAVIVVAYLLNVANTQGPEGWISQYTTTELWAIPLLVGVVYLARRREWAFAAVLALLALLVRELTACLLLGGLLGAMSSQRDRAPWLAACVLGVLAYGAHAAHVVPHLVPAGEGKETLLVGSAQIPASTIRMMGFGLPFGLVAGPILWVAALVRIGSGRRREAWLLIPFLLLPFAGLIVDRPYWGTLIVPFTILWGVDALGAVVRGRLDMNLDTVRAPDTLVGPE